MFNTIMILIFTCLFACKKENNPPEYHKRIEIDVLSGEKIQYPLYIEADGFTYDILDSTNHHQISELVYDSLFVHVYQSKNDFVGIDSMYLKSTKIDDVHKDIISITYLKLIQNVK